MASRLWSLYNKSLTKQPILTKAFTSFTGFTIGDVLAQKYLEDEEGREYDFQRTARLASFGFLIHGTTGHFFYKHLDKLLPSTDKVTVLKKVLIDQVFWNPTFAVLFFGYNNLLEKKSLIQFKEKMRKDFTTAYFGSWSVWGPAHFINFTFVSPSQRLLYINCVQIGYNVFLSFLANKKTGETGSEEAKVAKGEEVKEKVKEKGV